MDPRCRPAPSRPRVTPSPATSSQASVSLRPPPPFSSPSFRQQAASSSSYLHYYGMPAAPVAGAWRPRPPYPAPPFHQPAVSTISYYQGLHAPPNHQFATPHYPYLYPPLDLPSPDPRFPDRRQYIQICRVGRRNFPAEAERIKRFIRNTQFNVVSMDTEYPGTVHSSSDHKDRHPAAQYAFMKSNVDELALIQVGLTLSDASGNLATLDHTDQVIVWEFAISDFDLHRHKYVRESIDMLRSRGLNLEFHKQEGIHSQTFVQMLIDAGLVRVPGDDTRVQPGKEVRWITFHGAYDFGYLIKALIKNNLPERLEDFKQLVRSYFGNHVYDIKYIMRYCYNRDTGRTLSGGLEELAAKLGAGRILGVGHQAGSDSLLTLQVFKELKKLYLSETLERTCAGHIYPLAN